MKVHTFFPQILSVNGAEEISQRYFFNIQSLLNEVLPKNMLSSLNQGNLSLKEVLPIVKWSDVHLAPSNISVILLCKHRKGAACFFHDMVRRWLLPPKILNVQTFFATDFSFEKESGEILTISEVTISLSKDQDIEDVQEQMRVVDTEIRLGVVSNYHANRIMEFKGLSTDGKTAMIQEKIGSLIQKRSEDYDSSIISQMQKFLVTCRDEFKNVRDYHHISRIISILYLMRKMLKQKMENLPKNRHLIVKFLKTKVYLPEGEKNVLGVLVGLNFLREYEVFEKHHLIHSISQYIPNINMVSDSCIVDRNREAGFETIYLEIKKEDAQDFYFDEIENLRKALPGHLKNHIEYLTHPIFMPRNEEEVMRNIMTLSRQLKYVNDIPQVVINFEEQKAQDLIFTIILLRLSKPESPTVSRILSENKQEESIEVDRVCKVGSLRRKYAKEAIVFRISIPSKKYFRQDHSVDLYKAREKVVESAQKIFGEFRDYNGGMIFKQNEALRSLKSKLGQIAKTHEILLEKFFYALQPMEMRSILEIETMKDFFLLLLEFFKKKKSFHSHAIDWYYKQDAKKAMVILPTKSPLCKSKKTEKIRKMHLSTHEFVSFSLESDSECLGYMILTEDKDKQKYFIEALERSLDF